MLNPYSILWFKDFSLWELILPHNYIYHGPVEMKKILGRLRIIKYFRPPWLVDEENFSFQIV